MRAAYKESVVTIGGVRVRPQLLWSCAALLLCSAYFSLLWDAGISAAVRGIDLPGDIAKFIDLSEVFAHGLGVATIVAALMLAAPHRRRPLLFVILLTMTAGLTANAAKMCFVRVRPHSAKELALANSQSSLLLQSKSVSLISPAPGSQEATVLERNPTLKRDPTAVQPAGQEISASFWDARQRSFPSGHAATAWGFGLGLSLVFPRAFWLFGMLAVAASVQRLTSGAHFPSDVLAGAAIAFACSAGLVWCPWSRKLLESDSVDPSTSADETILPAIEKRSA